MHPIPSEQLLLVGKVLRPHGKRGALRILSYARSETTFLESGPVFLKTISGKWDKATVQSVRPYKSSYLLDLEGVNSISVAEQYRSAEIYIAKEKLIRDGDEYFWYELLGLDVYLDSGEFLGCISQIIPTPSGDIYLAEQGEKEVHIPAVHEVVKEIDLENRKMTIYKVEGLLDLNEV